MSQPKKKNRYDLVLGHTGFIREEKSEIIQEAFKSLAPLGGTLLERVENFLGRPASQGKGDSRIPSEKSGEDPGTESSAPSK